MIPFPFYENILVSLGTFQPTLVCPKPDLLFLDSSDKKPKHVLLYNVLSLKTKYKENRLFL